MKEAITISTDQNSGNADFDFLRQEGIKILQALGGEAWTDHNRHDPGITILEQLCYAISDLCYRISFDVPDILANSPEGLNGLHTPYEVLTGNPVTLADLRKIVLDVPGVRNAWIEPQSFKISYRREDQSLGDAARPDTMIRDIRGLYHVAVEVFEENLGSSVKELVRMRTQACRPIGEDFVDFIILKEQPITVKAALEIGQVEDPEGFLAGIYDAINETLSPTPRFFTLQEMLRQGYAAEDIMNGPRLIHGFLKDEDAGVNRKPAIFTSDLIRVLHSMPGLTAVKSFQLISRNQVKDWKLDIDPDRIPKLSMNFGEGQHIELFRNGVRLPLDNDLVAKRFNEIKARNRKKILSRDQRDIIPGKKTTRHIDLYHSIQHHFPEIYALAEGSLSANASPQRQAQQTQLRAYLLFFDQALANYHSQLGHLHDLFAFSTGNAYAEQVPGDVPALSSVIPELGSYQDTLSALFRADGEKNKQRSRSLNHLMARFAEDFTQFSMLVQDTRQRKDFENHCKVNLLKDYPGISGDRARASNSMQAVDLGGLEKRILLKLGLTPDGPRYFYIVEHILLRPTANDRFQSPAFMKLATAGDLPAANEIDPFSLQITYVFPSPAAVKIAQDVIELVLREETPAHIQAGVVWLTESYATLASMFTSMYTRWRLEMEEMTDPIKLRALRNWLIDFLELGKTYPISDLLLPPPRIVRHGTKGEALLPYAEPDVTYQLVNDTYKGPKVKGNNGPLTLYTEDLQEDTEFTVMAEKTGSLLSTALRTKLFFKVGIDRELDIVLLEKTPLVCNTTATLVINDSQQKVGYKLFDTGGNGLSTEIMGTGGKISLTTSSPLREDVVLVLKASKTFSDTKSTIVTIKELPVTVHPDAAIAVVTTNETPYSTGLTTTILEPMISLKNTQRSVSYKVYIKAFDENDIVYEDRPTGDDLWNLSYNDGVMGRRQIIVRDPAHLPFTEIASVQGTGGDLNITIPASQDDQIVFITATKVRGTGADSLRLREKPVILRMPRTVTWYAPPQVSKGEVATIRITNPQRGVTYQLVDPTGASAAGVPVHFHKNKPIEAGRIGVDFVVNGIDEVVLMTPPLQVESQFVIRATRFYTGISLISNVIRIKVSFWVA
ncbi:hypothetical protein KK083_19375 [Fulvivirgaceae bacterium PWU4]|uniref:Uncharacterized protein n=1 Tax=Chryseosolibacter histidini TaxID=2782349 RepID=A0AAP2DMJ1_9BACT|nr:hypothetical protein [Chryseosolibacter histidini]MBT1699065.1 hypothetical protein [Chryseosolibacter histidini]